MFTITVLLNLKIKKRILLLFIIKNYLIYNKLYVIT
jgi:hypothetical protein